MNERESIIICEGFYDRAFWHGLLVHQFACKDKRMSGPWGDPKGGGIYGLYSPSKFPLRIQPISQQPERQTGEKKDGDFLQDVRRNHSSIL